MLIERTAPVVWEKRNAFQAFSADVAWSSRYRMCPHPDELQRVEMPSPDRSISTATTVAPRLVSAAVRRAKAFRCSVHHAGESKATGRPRASTRSASSYLLH